MLASPNPSVDAYVDDSSRLPPILLRFSLQDRKRSDRVAGFLQKQLEAARL